MEMHEMCELRAFGSKMHTFWRALYSTKHNESERHAKTSKTNNDVDSSTASIRPTPGGSPSSWG